MKKTLKTIIALIAAVVLLSGCGMKTQSGFKITSNGNIQVQMIMAYDDEMIDAMLTAQENPEAESIKTHTDAERWAYIESDEGGMSSSAPAGYKKERYDQDGFKGYKFTQDLGHIDNVSSSSASSRVDIGSIEGDFNGQVLFIKNGDTYKSNMTIKQAADTSEYEQYESQGMIMDVKFVVELPSKPISNNAANVSADGKTLYWDLTKTGDIDFSFTLNGNGGSVVDPGEDPVEPEGPIEEPTEPGEEPKKESKKSSKDDDDDEDSKLPLIIGISVGAGVLLLLIIVAAVAASKKKKANAAVVQPAVMTPTFEQPVQQPTIEPAQPQDPNQQQ